MIGFSRDWRNSSLCLIRGKLLISVLQVLRFALYAYKSVGDFYALYIANNLFLTSIIRQMRQENLEG